MEKAAVSGDGLLIPLIDLSKFLEGGEAQRRETAKAILHGFQTAGFIYLKNTPIAPEVRKKVFDMSARFFKQTPEDKMSVAWTTPEANRGYSEIGKEKNTQLVDAADVAKLKDEVPDIKETMDIGREDEEPYPNQWPAEVNGLDGFKVLMNDFFQQCKSVHVEVMRAIAVGMDLDANIFDSYVDVGDNTLRLLHYPEVESAVFEANPNQVRTGEHSDYGSITLLFQDASGGLQVKSPNGNFVDATPIEDTIVINAGDLLARWSNDTIKSTIHRVIQPPVQPVNGVYPSRFSIAYFCNPNFVSQIEAIPGTYADETERKYEGVNTGDRKSVV